MKGMAAHSSTLAWEIPRTEGPGGLQPWSPKASDTEQLTHSVKTKVYQVFLIDCHLF